MWKVSEKLNVPVLYVIKHYFNPYILLEIKSTAYYMYEEHMEYEKMEEDIKK